MNRFDLMQVSTFKARLRYGNQGFPCILKLTLGTEVEDLFRSPSRALCVLLASNTTRRPWPILEAHRVTERPPSARFSLPVDHSLNSTCVPVGREGGGGSTKGKRRSTTSQPAVRPNEICCGDCVECSSTRRRRRRPSAS